MMAYEAAPADEPTPVTGRPRRWLVPVAAALVALVVGLGGGYVLGGLRPADVSSPTPTAFEGTEIFDEPQESGDQPTVDLPGILRVSEFRVLLTGLEGTDLPFVYAARGAFGALCLVVIVGEESRISYSCIDEVDFPSSGLQVGWFTENDEGIATWDEFGGIQTQ